MKERFIEKFREAIDAEGKEIRLEDKFREYEEWDSLRFLSVISMIDTEFDIIIDAPDFRKIQTIGGLIEEIEKRLNN